MKKINLKSFLKNCLIIFTINFLLLFIFQIFQDNKFYSTYSSEDYSRFFSTMEIILWDFKMSLYFTCMESIIFIPTLLILEKVNIKNIIRIIITYIILFVAIILYLLKNFSITFWYNNYFIFLTRSNLNPCFFISIIKDSKAS